MYSRRRFGALALAALPWATASRSRMIDSKVHGIQWGLQSYSFTGAPKEGILDLVIKAMVEAGLGECDIYSPLIEPPGLSAAVRGGAAGPGRGMPPAAATPGAPDPRAQAREQLARWRATAPLSYFEDIRAKFNRAGNVVTLSKRFWISLDIGDATGGGWDPLPFVRDHHERIALLYIKDRKKDNTSMPWGEGDTPVKEVLRLVRGRKLPIRCYVDNDYKSPLPRIEDVKRSFEWAKKVLG